MRLWYFLITQHVRIQEKSSGEGGPGPSTTSFVSAQPNLQKYNEFFSKKTIIFQDFRGGPTFSGGSNFSGGCPIAYSLYEPK